MTEIISGRAPIEPDTALQLERVLGHEAGRWLALEACYRLGLAEQAERSRMGENAEWAARFPLGEMRRRGLLPEGTSPAAAVPHLLRLFGAGTVEACQARFAELLAGSYRHSPSFKSADGALLVWLRLGERAAEALEMGDYDRRRFVEALQSARTLTGLPLEEFLPLLRELCAVAGVAFVIEAPLKGVALSGVSRWLTPRRALIQQTLRHRTDDHFWFTFFHEAAHLLLHSRRMVFLDGQSELTTGSEEDEREANAWAGGFLVPPAAMHAFVERADFRAAAVAAFADTVGVSPGIVVGQLQKAGVLAYGSGLNSLKRRLDLPA
ncbi:ImmA/IrrE family metallo-endopeptidase [Methylorubrum extorquens]|nr:ImmA/IrrE family metallo-endopeptidase [Methylorubrum extorquens]